MNSPLLISGNKNYSSWSLRAWLLLKAFDIEFDEQSIELFDPSATSILAEHAPTGKVPVLVYYHGGNKVTVWDTLSIAIHINDYLTDVDIWTGLCTSDIKRHADSHTRTNSAYCQSIVAEMHSGLTGIRNEMPMNIRATAHITPSAACLADIDRIETIITECLTNRSADSYLFGNFTVADAFYAPVVLRLQTYATASGIELKPTTLQYCKTMLANPHLQIWRAEALKETRIIKEDEAGKTLSLDGVLAG
ncbi:glutathione S-transferase family protein [Psychrobacter sp.]|uniref:glutathione S-transferase family protein n=1 Tax=Psychrobacter sp. TaxID=56811 RepID=UPI002647AD44|nr:glutathione S-transferase family protein [Psychrobacter sp.]MDN6275900.1 glutathione S-transferase family protein [Psychrobacter sp.]MDN6308355.1 glutathione S-transferase family protein [Psychrobacter sp.]